MLRLRSDKGPSSRLNSNENLQLNLDDLLDEQSLRGHRKIVTDARVGILFFFS